MVTISVSMTPKYCQNCGTKAESALAKFCASCGNPLNGLPAAKSVAAQARTMPSRLSRTSQVDDGDDDEGTDTDVVPQLSKLDFEISDDGPSEFAGFSAANTFSFNPDGTQSPRKFKPRRL